MRAIFVTAFLGMALVGSLAGYLVQIELLCIFGWVNFLVLVVLLAAWNKADARITVSIVLTSLVFWFFVFGGNFLK